MRSKPYLLKVENLDLEVNNPTRSKEYLSLLIQLYKNNGSVLHVDNFFLFIHRLYSAVQNLKSTCTMVYGNKLPLPCYPVG